MPISYGPSKSAREMDDVACRRSCGYSRGRKCLADTARTTDSNIDDCPRKNVIVCTAKLMSGYCMCSGAH